MNTLLRLAVVILLAQFMAVTPPASGEGLPAGERLKNLTPAGFSIGGVLHAYDPNSFAPEYVDTAVREFNSTTLSTYMAYGAWPDPATPPLIQPWNDAVDWALANDLPVHGHSLVYPSANANLGWYTALPDDQIEPVLETFVMATAGARAGSIWVWDVVNEVMADDGSPMDADGLRTDVREYIAIGPDYVDKAFHWAAAADPCSLRIINDYAIADGHAKADRLLAYMIKLRNRGVPIDGVGFQLHFLDTTSTPDAAAIAGNFQRFADAGFRIFITELDIPATRSSSASELPSDAETERQRAAYKEITRVAVEQPACDAMFFWDFADQRSWLHPSIIDSSFVSLGEFTFPTIFSGGLQDPIGAKPAYFGVQEALTEFAGAYRIRSGLASDSGLLSRVAGDNGQGGVYATDQVRLVSECDPELSESSIRWTLEPVMSGVFRIRSLWNSETGYLSRAGSFDGQQWQPGPGVYLATLEPDWLSQMWFVDCQPDGTLLLQSAWGSDSGYLTRDTKLKPRRWKHRRTFTRVPLDTVSAQPLTGCASHWFLEPTR